MDAMFLCQSLLLGTYVLRTYILRIITYLRTLSQAVTTAANCVPHVPVHTDVSLLLSDAKQVGLILEMASAHAPLVFVPLQRLFIKVE